MDQQSRSAKILARALALIPVDETNTTESSPKATSSKSQKHKDFSPVAVSEIISLDVCTNVQPVSVLQDISNLDNLNLLLHSTDEAMPFTTTTDGDLTNIFCYDNELSCKENTYSSTHTMKLQEYNITEELNEDDISRQDFGVSNVGLQFYSDTATVDNSNIEQMNNADLPEHEGQGISSQGIEIDQAPIVEKEFQEYSKDVVPTESPVEEEEVVEKKRRKRRLVNPADWSVNRNQLNRQMGREYFGKCKEEAGWDYRVKKQAKHSKPPCTCDVNSGFKCYMISEEERTKLFEKFWKYSWKEKRVYISTLTEKFTPKRARNRLEENVTRRTYSYKYFLELQGAGKIRVCKTMFCNTFSIPLRTIGDWILKNDVSDVKAVSEQVVPISIKYRRKDDQANSLKAFFDALPKLESHYCRKSTSKLYLEPSWTTKSELYRFYKENWCKDLAPLSITSFTNMFEDMNLSLFSPKKDECDVCVAFRTKNLDEEAYQIHLTKKQEARDEKTKDKSAEDNKVFTMDMQSVLLCPKTNVSSQYFKTKLIVHNFTLFDLKTKQGYCYLWHEGEGGLSSNVFASIVCHFLISQLTDGDPKQLIFYSDGCTCQNRNSTMSNALLNLAIEKNVTIIQKYLERGHTQMECDAMHSTIERKIRKRKINVPADYVEICQTARRNPFPYKVEYLDHTFFKTFDKIKFVTSIRPGRATGDATVNEIRALKYNPSCSIDFKLRHTEDWQPLPSRLNKTTNMCPFKELPSLYSEAIAIKKDKFEHLMALKNALEPDYHEFYNKLKQTA